MILKYNGFGGKKKNNNIKKKKKEKEKNDWMQELLEHYIAGMHS